MGASGALRAPALLTFGPDVVSHDALASGGGPGGGAGIQRRGGANRVRLGG
jgi:hypothetical protein